MQSTWPLVKRWTAEEHHRLKTLAESGMRADEIAATLSRSEKAVRARAWQHGITLKLLAPKPGPPKRVHVKTR
ncbi:hypothetical protein PMI42_04686 [Bradyrhizobium sp. YR681]|uniref:hypothetical protein n=1 Tax=Bradyrhizobium sp. YR681 TaxID=1144344 RepID=UPI000270EF3B|nr:hypothetical protein [Bradyrhizobium sp. YR681]EJN11967.1 hypothetical protein PMI42_04686 [Bradyrhizobium sp. YR681]